MKSEVLYPVIDGKYKCLLKAHGKGRRRRSALTTGRRLETFPLFLPVFWLFLKHASYCDINVAKGTKQCSLKSWPKMSKSVSWAKLFSFRVARFRYFVMATGRWLTNVLVGMSEDLQFAAELLEFKSQKSKTEMNKHGRNKAPRGLFPGCPLLLLCFLLLAAALFLLYFAWCGYSVKGSYCI